MNNHDANTLIGNCEDRLLWRLTSWFIQTAELTGNIQMNWRLVLIAVLNAESLYRLYMLAVFMLSTSDSFPPKEKHN